MSITVLIQLKLILTLTRPSWTSNNLFNRESNSDILYPTKIKNLDVKKYVGKQYEILVKNQNFDQKSKFWSKIVILVKNCNFGQKL